jgi:hypothetical protein
MLKDKLASPKPAGAEKKEESSPKKESPFLKKPKTTPEKFGDGFNSFHESKSATASAGAGSLSAGSASAGSASATASSTSERSKRFYKLDGEFADELDDVNLDKLTPGK